jgi:tartrate-resistant acid phosphatase type 5
MRRVVVTVVVAFVTACPSRGRVAVPDGGLVGAADAGVSGVPARSTDGGLDVRFVAVGDTGHGNEAQYAVGRAMATVCQAQGCDFVVLLGDNFYPSGVDSETDPQWQSAFVKPYAALDVPFYAVLGNHDYGGNGSGSELDKGQHQVDYARVNPKWRMPATHYRFSQGGVDFFAADTNRSMYGLDQRVQADFDQWLGGSRAQWRIAFGHHPLRSNGRHGNAGAYDGVPSLVPIASGEGVKTFLEEHVCGKVDAYFCGHEHVLEWLADTCTSDGGVQTELLISGGGSEHTGFREAPTNRDWWRGDQPGFVYVVLQGSRFIGTWYSDDGKVLFARSFSK